jgi:hypothetical protein
MAARSQVDGEQQRAERPGDEPTQPEQASLADQEPGEAEASERPADVRDEAQLLRLIT